MSARADLFGAEIADGNDGRWYVVRKAPAQNRVPFWTCVHQAGEDADTCPEVDLPHVSLNKAIAGKGGLPRCVNCTPEGPRIDHGLHLACGSTHLLGTDCPDGSIVPASSGMAGGAPWSLDGLGHVEPDGSTFHASTEDFLASLAPVAIEPAAHLADATTGALVVHGRVDRLEAPQPLLDVIRRGMEGRERNHQSQPGPSQIGGCERKLGYHLAFGDGNGARDDSAWRPEVGTAVHAWLDEMFALEGRTAGRWISNYAVTTPIAGKLDLYDAQDRRVIDFKVSGKTVTDKAAKGIVAEKYEVQLDLYGLGMLADGYPVERVALLFLPPAGSLSEAVWYDRPFDITRALSSVAKRDRIAAMLTVAEPGAVLAALSITEDYCGSCPAFGTHCEGGFAPTTPALGLVGAP